MISGVTTDSGYGAIMNLHLQSVIVLLLPADVLCHVADHN